MKLAVLLGSAVVLGMVELVVGPPVTANKQADSDKKAGEGKGDDWDIGLEYNRYLQEVVQTLESDPQFREKLEKAEVADIRTGKIASELEFVNHNVRSKLDELKRQELERLRHLAVKEFEIQQAQRVEHEEEEEQGNEVDDQQHVKMKMPFHLDHHNPHSFEIEDLRKLIIQTTKDLEEADKQRRQEFKEYEMQKEYEKSQQLNLLDDEHKKEFEHKIEEQEKKHKVHPSLHHPGSKQQLEEVWEEQDHMNPEDFNPKTFFHLHDLDGNGFWDTDEVKALFQKELDKMYDPNAPEDDMKERREEMERMREHVFTESDTNKDHLISFQEFLEQTKKKEYDQDQGWQGLDDQKLYTHEEYLEFERKRQEEVQKLIAQGMLPPQPQDMHLPYGIQIPPEYLHHQQMQQQLHHPQLAPQQVPPHQQGHQPQHFQQHPDPQQAYHHQQQQQGYHGNPPPVAPLHHQQPPQNFQQHPPQHNQQQQNFPNQNTHGNQLHQNPPQPQVYHDSNQQYHQNQPRNPPPPPVHSQQERNEHPNQNQQNPPPAQGQNHQDPNQQYNQNQQQQQNALPVHSQGQADSKQQQQPVAHPSEVKQHNSPPLHSSQVGGVSASHDSAALPQKH